VPCFEDGTENKEGNSYSAQDEAKTLTAKDAVLKGVNNPKKKKKKLYVTNLLVAKDAMALKAAKISSEKQV
jgi:hypothetical protein